MKPTAEAVTRLVEQIKPLLAGHGPEMHGGALADLLAILLAGHIVPGDAAATLQLRAEILAAHLEAVAALIPINAKAIGIDQD
jgi:hypothetical protein